jgi:acyl-CoA hydrolase/GNAT superfamily N-acetyltransferase
MSDRIGSRPRDDRYVTADTAARSIRSGDRIFVGTGCAEPRTLVRALEELRPGPADVELVSIFPTGHFDPTEPPPRRHRNRAFLGGGSDIDAASMIDYVPIALDEVPALLAQGRLPIDVAIVQVSVPDERGYASLGISVDLAPAAVHAAKRVIAEVNPAMPRSHGDGFIHVDRIDMLVDVDTPVAEFVLPRCGEAGIHIAAYIASLIEDGSTLQIGLGAVPDHVLRLLGDRRDLGVHTDLLTDGIVDLIRSGAITGQHKSILKDRVVASYCLGTRRLYDLVHDNPLFHFAALEQVCAPDILARSTRLVSITEARSIDLTGQVCVDHLAGVFKGGPSTQAAFMRGAARSPGGKSIVCLTCIAEDGSSRIKAALDAPEAVGVVRADVHYVVTEFGIAYLFGRTVRERALALVGIAHPEHRPALLDAAKHLGLLPADQSLVSRTDYAVQAERRLALRNGVMVLLRPAGPPDAAALLALFHTLSQTDVYTRFFRRMRSLSDADLQSLCNVNHEGDVAYVATIGPREQETVIGSGCYFLNPATGLAEVAFMVVPNWQGSGVGGALQQRLREHAQGQGVLGFVAEVLPQNERMLRLARSAAGRSTVASDEDGVKITTWFAD